MLLIAIAQFIYATFLGTPDFGFIAGATIIAFAGLFVSVPVTLLYGLPMYLLLKKFGWLSIYSAVLVTIFPSLVYGIFIHSAYSFLMALYFSMWVGFVFWWFVPRR